MNLEFDVIHRTFSNNTHPVIKYRSKSTGLAIYHAQVHGPMVNGYIVIGTFPEDDDGLPHTLEHLIFLGSQRYPHNGVLDMLAGKCVSAGTNAYTDSDHTCYTFSSAGQEGFTCLLPIYLDHVFFPTLEDSGFDTEIHHIDGTGEDRGVVYSEQQAKETDIDVMSLYELSRTFYPPNSGYHYVSGGVLKNLRDSTNMTKIRLFHRKYYSAKNACIIVCGIMDPQKLFNCLTHFISDLRKKGNLNDVEKLWNLPVPQLAEPIVKQIQCPGEDESQAMVHVAFIGPNVATHFEDSVAMKILFAYLADNSTGPLQTEFVEGEEHICDGVSYGEIENSDPVEFFVFEQVGLDDLQKVTSRLRTALERQLLEFESARMTECVKQCIQEELSSMENSPHDSIAYACITDFLYGKGNPKMFEKRLNASAICKELVNRTKEEWISFIQHNILDQKWVTIIATPSLKAYLDLRKLTRERSERRVAILGTAGLEKIQNKLSKTETKHKEPIPPHIIAAIPVPTTRAIDFHQIERNMNPDFAKDFDCNIILDDISSNFVYVTVHMDTTNLTPKLRKYLALYIQSLTQSEMSGDTGNSIIEYEDVIEGLSQNLINQNIFLGIKAVSPFTCGDFNHIMSVNVQFEIEKIDIGFKWLRRMLFQIHWTSSRLKISARKLINELNEQKKKGLKLAKSLVDNALFKYESNTYCLQPVRQHVFLSRILDSLPAKEQKIISKLEDIRSTLTTPTNITIQIATSVDKMVNVFRSKNLHMRTILREMFPFTNDEIPSKRIANTPDTFWMNDTWKHSPSSTILGLGEVESGYLYQVCPGITDYNDPEFPALATAINYFVQIEGPLYKAIRGGGYAYEFHMYPNPSKGLIVFQLSKCSSTVSAYRASKDTILSHLYKPEIWTPDLLSSAQSSLMCEIIDKEATPLNLAMQSLTSSYNNIQWDFFRKQIGRIQAITLTDVKRVTKKYLEPLFTKPTNCGVVVPRERVEKVIEAFKKIGKVLTEVAIGGTLAEWKV